MATKLLTAAALVMGLSFSTVAFAGDPKTDAKTTVKTESSAKTEGTAQTYFAIKSTDPNDPVAFHWTDDPAAVQNLDCKPLTGASCEITTQQTPVDGMVPSDAETSDSAYQ